jgi:hypothetical protein
MRNARYINIFLLEKEKFLLCARQTICLTYKVLENMDSMYFVPFSKKNKNTILMEYGARSRSVEVDRVCQCLRT